MGMPITKAKQREVIALRAAGANWSEISRKTGVTWRVAKAYGEAKGDLPKKAKLATREEIADRRKAILALGPRYPTMNEIARFLGASHGMTRDKVEKDIRTLRRDGHDIKLSAAGRGRPPLSADEISQLHALAASGLSAPEIALKINRSPAAVRTHCAGKVLVIESPPPALKSYTTTTPACTIP